jgi:hypothetical protein
LKGGIFSKFEWRPRVFKFENSNLHWAKPGNMNKRSKHIKLPGCTLKKGMFRNDFVIEICSKEKYYYRLRFKDVKEGQNILKKVRLILKRERTLADPAPRRGKRSEQDDSYSQSQSSGSIVNTDKLNDSESYTGSYTGSYSGSSYTGSYTGSYSGSVRSSSSVTASGVSQKSKGKKGNDSGSSSVYSSQDTSS